MNDDEIKYVLNQLIEISNLVAVLRSKYDEKCALLESVQKAYEAKAAEVFALMAQNEKIAEMRIKDCEDAIRAETRAASTFEDYEVEKERGRVLEAKLAAIQQGPEDEKVREARSEAYEDAACDIECFDAAYNRHNGIGNAACPPCDDCVKAARLRGKAAAHPTPGQENQDAPKA